MSFLMPKINIPQPATPAQLPTEGANTPKSSMTPSFLGSQDTPPAAASTGGAQKKLLGA